MDRHRFFDQILDTRTSFELLINRVHTTRMTISGVVGRWSVKDTLAYILVCEQYLTERMSEILTDGHLYGDESSRELDELLLNFNHPDFGSPFFEEATITDLIIQKYKSIPLEEVVTQENHAYLSLIAMMEKMEPELLEEVGFCERFVVHLLTLFDAHHDLINSWLESVR